MDSRAAVTYRSSAGMKSRGDHMRAFSAMAIAVILAAAGAHAFAQADKANFGNRQAVIINNAIGMIDLSDFKFENRPAEYRHQLHTDLRWKNTSSKVITAFEVVLLRFDPFNRPLYAGTWMITGTSSTDWSPLLPGKSSSDSLVGFRAEAILTSVAYVRAIRFEDGFIWTADIPRVEQAIHQRLPALKDLGDVNPPSEGLP
jgi:hypothetical protein